MLYNTLSLSLSLSLSHSLTLFSSCFYFLMQLIVVYLFLALLSISNYHYYCLFSHTIRFWVNRIFLFTDLAKMKIQWTWSQTENERDSMVCLIECMVEKKTINQFSGQLILWCCRAYIPMNYLCNRTNKLLDCIEMPPNAHTIDLNSDTLLSHILQHSSQKKSVVWDKTWNCITFSKYR